ncbi:MAG: hypothetical protein ACXWXL_03300 [Candidatus Binatia bacterium]
MTIVRITEPGSEGFNGDIGGIEFKDGVSTRNLSPVEVTRLSASMRVVNDETRKQVGVAATLVESKHVEARVDEPLKTQRDPVVENQTERPRYTREELEAIADKGGIAELRKIADELGVKGKAIQTLIDGILTK